MLRKFIEITYTRHDGQVDCEELAEWIINLRDRNNNTIDDIVRGYLAVHGYLETPQNDIERIKYQALQWVEQLEKEEK